VLARECEAHERFDEAAALYARLLLKARRGPQGWAA